ncbi:cytochrome P450 [Chitinophaga nivalis]|uniref:Cytochrome P450 n=1 Tax=Chitinophaga nivalis TaxID=2991709 RepID=A0ABT3IUU1_9BACT|nr:cytochrome P450 [Chitinophaga nivalis]MCW3462585.1 cytochrome P450 [Chitinophaga nivalis]MCW3487724.1 cytochrome P450 [Chitinophaga nivalis]
MEKINSVPDSLLAPIPWFRQMQKDNPVFFDSRFTLFSGTTGAWHVFRYEDVAQVFRDHGSFTSAYIPKSANNVLLGESLIFKDPPDHTKLRKVLSKGLSPFLVNRMESTVVELTQQMLTPFLEKGEMDFMKDFADLLPLWIVMKILGIRDEDFEVVKNLSGTILASPEMTRDYEMFFKAQLEGKQFLEEVIRQHEVEPKNDFIGILLNSKIEDQSVSVLDMVSLSFSVMLGGVESTTAFLGNVMRALITYPDIQDQVRQQPADLPAMLNEVLRFYPSIFTFSRVAAKDVELGGQQIHKGDFMVPWLGATNFDDAIFPEPDVFDINRKNLGQILNFGHGIHYCPGEAVSRQEARAAFGYLLPQLSDIKLKEGAALTLHPSTTVNCLKSLPITFTYNGEK